MKVRILCILAVLFAGPIAPLTAQQPDWSGVERVFGRPGAVQSDMIKVTFPRTDLRVEVNGIAVSPALALTSWAAFRPMQDSAMMMGDLVLLETEVPAVMKRLEAGGIAITALHNHLMNELPRVMYMHFSGVGGSDALARALKNALAETATPLGPPQLPGKPASTDWSSVESILGYKGASKGDVLQVGIPRAGLIKEGGMEIPPFMGMANSINIQVAGGKAATTGDFVLTSGEVNPVLRALNEHGIAVTAIHSHMLDEVPRIFFMHFWAVDDPAALARGLRAALDKIDLRPKE